MTTAHDIHLPTVLADRLTTCHPDVLRELLATFIHTLMGAEADALCGAGYGQRSSERTESPWFLRRLGLLDFDQGLVAPFRIAEGGFELCRG